MTRSIDHCVLPVASLDEARARLTALGFTVAPEGVHPFGTRNACVYFEDGTFLEPLAVGDADQAREAIAAGNVFVARDAAYRASRGDDGFSALVFGSDDADADHLDFVSANLSAGPRLDFSRPFVDATGRVDSAAFRLAFAGHPGSPDAFFFTCERVNAPSVDRGALQRHPNGATGIREIVMTADAPGSHRRLLAALTSAEMEPVAGGFSVALANARLSVLTPAAYRAAYGSPADADGGLRLRAVVFAVADRATRPLDNERVIHPQPGQGAAFVFEAATSPATA